MANQKVPPGPTEPTAPSERNPPPLTPAADQLWSEFLGELSDDESWDHEFTPSPYDPGKAMRTFIDRAKASAAPVLIGVIRGNEDNGLNYWACVGLNWLGALAGPEAAIELEARASAGEKIYWPAASALEALDPARARSANFERDPSVLDHLLRFYLDRGMESACGFIDRIIDRGDASAIERTLKDMWLRAAAAKNFPPRLAERVRVLSQSHSSSAVRAAAANLLAEAKAPESASRLISTLGNNGQVGIGAIERLASHPESEYLLIPIVNEGNLSALSNLLLRRRCAGWATHPALMRSLLTEKLERPKREWRYEEHDVHFAALCVAELQDTELIGSLVKAVVPENSGFAWEPLARAFRALGTTALQALQSELAACPPGERRTRIEWMLDRVAKPYPRLKEMLENADSTFLRGRVEPTIWGAFRAYGDILLAVPSAHAAFQLAWIDRAFGSEIVPARVNWIRSLGFYDEELLAELAAPVASPLTGYRSEWDGGESRKRNPERAARAAEAGLPSLAAHWYRDDRYESAAKEQRARVRRAAARKKIPRPQPNAPPKYIAISDCDICKNLKEYQRSFVKLGREHEATHLPSAAARLLNRERCPICGTFYKYKFEYEFLIGGSEDEEILTRLTFSQARSLLTASEYDAIMRWMPSNLIHPDTRTRHYAAKCLVSHYLERCDAGAILSYLEHADPDVVLGALDFLLDASDEKETTPVLLELVGKFQELITSSHETVARWAGAIVDRLPKPLPG
jgi:hypothetical protein